MVVRTGRSKSEGIVARAFEKVQQPNGMRLGSGTGRCSQHIYLLAQKIGDFDHGPACGVEDWQLKRICLTTQIRRPRIHSLSVQFRLSSRPFEARPPNRRRAIQQQNASMTHAKAPIR